MKKMIILKDGTKREMEINQEFLDMYMGQARAAYTRATGKFNLTEDEMQELRMALCIAFNKYDVTTGNKFSTLLEWEVKGYIRKEFVAETSQKRKSTFAIVELDATTVSDKGDGEKDLHSTIKDSSIPIEDAFIEKDFMKYLDDKLTDLEKRLLQANLKQIKFSEIIEETGKSKQSICNMNAKFKKRLIKIMAEYNR